MLATHYPFLDRTLAFARVHPQRSYALACRIAGEPPHGHVHQRRLADPLGPRRAARRRGAAAGRRRGPPAGTGGDTEERYGGLEAFAREHWDVQSVEYRWSSQDNTTVDTLPYVGAARRRARTAC